MLEKKFRRYKLMETHRTLTRQSRNMEAKTVLRLLREGKVKLGLSDSDWAVEKLCEDMGYHISYSRNGYTATVYM